MRRPVSRRTVALRGLKQSGKFPSGNPRFYYRYTKPQTPMPDAPIHSAEFRAAHAAAEQAAPLKSSPAVKHATGTIGAAIRAFLASDSFLARASSTRERWRSFAAEFEGVFGAARLSDLAPRHIRQYLANYGPHPANNRLKLWRALGRWWVEAGLLDTDPARDVRIRATPQTDGFTPWTQDDVDRFRHYWPIGTMQRLALEIMVSSGAAIGDAVRIGPGNVQGPWIVYTRAKSGTTCSIPAFVRPAPDYFPCTESLRECLRQAPRHTVWLSTKSGAARSPKAAGAWFVKAARAAGIEGKSAHGLRKYLAAYMAERGASDAQRMAILGHDTTSQARAYSKSANAKLIILGSKVDNTGQPPVNIAEI